MVRAAGAAGCDCLTRLTVFWKPRRAAFEVTVVFARVAAGGLGMERCYICCWRWGVGEYLYMFLCALRFSCEMTCPCRFQDCPVKWWPDRRYMCDDDTGRADIGIVVQASAAKHIKCPSCLQENAESHLPGNQRAVNRISTVTALPRTVQLASSCCPGSPHATEDMHI